MEFDSISPDQLCDGIGTKPLFQQLPRGMRESEVISGEPDLISDNVAYAPPAMVLFFLCLFTPLLVLRMLD